MFSVVALCACVDCRRPGPAGAEADDAAGPGDDQRLSADSKVHLDGTIWWLVDVGVVCLGTYSYTGLLLSFNYTGCSALPRTFHTQQKLTNTHSQNTLPHAQCSRRRRWPNQ